MFKQHLFNKTKRFQQISLVLVVLIVGGAGTYLLMSSNATTPYVSITAASGSLGSGASLQTDSTASNGASVRFGSASSGSGGGGSNMVVGLNESGWPNGPTDMAGAVKYDRLDQDLNEPATDFANAGVKVDVLFTGPYNSGGVSSINATSWANNALSWYQSHGCTPAECPMMEVLNEPEGSWFWGSNASDQTNATAYANLVKTAYTTFHTAYGANAPLVLAAYDSSTWGQEWWSSSLNSYVDGVIVHPYGGTGSPSQSKLGNRQLVTEAHSYTGKPVYVTEVGWPTAVGQPATGDSLQWPQSNTGAGTGDQCNNIYNFLSWARGTGYVNAVYIFGYRDYGTNDFYGVETSGGTKKPGWDALKAAANNQANPCPNPLTY